MVRVLILTENIENELPMFEKLRHLNHEVLISHDLVISWDKFARLPAWISAFPLVLISETLDKEKAEGISEYVNKDHQICLLKVDRQLSAEEQLQIEEIGITSCIHTEAKLSNVRETVREAENQQKQEVKKVQVLEKEPMDAFLKKLSPIYTRIFVALQQMNGEHLSRDQLSEKIWGKCNNATLSQLSASVRKINDQIYRTWGIAPGVITDWGKGYRLNEELCINEQALLSMSR